MLHVEVVPAIRFGDILISTLEIPLTDSAGISRLIAGRRTGVVTRRSDREQAIHEHDAAAHVLPVEIATDADVLNLKFTVAELLGGAAHCMIDRLVEIVDEVGVETNFGSKERGVEHH